MTKSSDSSPVEEPHIANPPEPLSSDSGPWRPNVAALVIRYQDQIPYLLLGERRDSDNYWQWPQGGQDPGESYLETLKRELFEEAGLTDFEVRHTFPFKLRYRFPKNLEARMGYVGQEQQFFIVHPHGEPSLEKAADNEFKRLTWKPLSEGADNAIWFKQALYDRVVAYAMDVLKGHPEGASK